MGRIRLFILCCGLMLLFSCGDNDNKNDDWKADLPELSVDSVSMLGVVGIYNAIMFSINDVPFIGLGHIPLVGKNNHFYYYSSEERSWKSIGEYPGGNREEATAFVIGNKAYVGLGSFIDRENGYSLLLYDDFFVYDYEKRSWESQPIKFPGGARVGAVAFSIDGKGYVGTGYGEGGDRFADFYEFSPETGWTAISNVGKVRARAHAFVANGYGYICSGVEANDILKFDPKSKTWKGQPICYEEDHTTEKDYTTELQPFISSSFVLNKNGEDFVYTSGSWGYNPQKNIWKKLDNPVVFGDYMFTMGGRGYAMSVDEEGRFFAKIFEVVE